MLVLAGLLLALVVAAAVANRPKAASIIWLSVMVCVPSWLTLNIGATLMPQTLAFIVILPALLRTAHGRISKVDILLFAFLVLSSIAWFAAHTPQYAFVTIFLQWLPAYWVGRYLAPAVGKDWIYRAIAVAATFAAAWSLVEFVFDWHVFLKLVDKTAGWNTIQRRGPYARSEGAFGHSIALGAFLALGLPFAFASRFRPVWRAIMVALIVGGVVVTFSRGALLGAVISLVVVVLYLPGSAISSRVRAFFVGALVILSFTALPAMLDLFDSVSSDLGPSTRYRENLTTHIFEDMSWLGPADAIQVTSSGRYVYRGTGSIDNTFLLTVLQFGWLPTLLLCLALLAVVFRVVRRRGGPADIALFAQILVMYTVALITQYGMAVWWIGGIAVAFGGRSRGDSIPEETSAKGSELVTSVRANLDLSASSTTIIRR